MRIAWTGSRPPEGGYTTAQVVAIALDVAGTVGYGDEVGTGGCIGVDEIVMLTVAMLRRNNTKLTLVTFPADADAWWVKSSRVPSRVMELTDAYGCHDSHVFTRDRMLVNWADVVRAIPSVPFALDADGKPVAGRGGTRYTARYAFDKGKLGNILTLPPKGV